MNIKNEITDLLHIKYPVIQAGMVWASGWKLASAVSNCGGLGLIGAGSMKPDLLKEQIQKCKQATQCSFGVNVPLMREDAPMLIDVIIQENVNIIFTSAGHPGKFIEKLKKNNLTVVHVVPSLKFALKAESAGCDAVVGEGVEAGGHNGADELTIFTLIPALISELRVPVIAAGGITNGSGILAALALGAKGVQMGTRFAATVESSAHDEYKKRICLASDTDTVLIFKKIGLTRTLANSFTKRIQLAEAAGADAAALNDLLGKKREMLGIFQGDAEEGLMEAGQGAGLIKDIPSVKNLFSTLLAEFDESLYKLSAYK